MSSYPYQPLNLPHETRILTVQPGEYEDAVVCSLEHMSLPTGDSDPYQCLSYCWSKSVNVEVVPPDDAMLGYAYGSGEGESGQISFQDMLDHPEMHRTYIHFGGSLPKRTISCNNVSMLIGGELHRALRRIRSKEHSLRIWVDAICIDQGNIEERNRHVLMMGSIYAGVSKLRIWLGEETGIEQLALEALGGVYEIVQESLDDDSLSNLTSLELQKTFQSNSKLKQLDWESLQYLFGRAWFRRIWILQEVVKSSAATVHIGEIEMDWDWITSALQFARRTKMDGLLRSAAMKPVSVMTWLASQTSDSHDESSLSLLDVLEETRVFESTLPSDKIYAVLGLTNQNSSIVVDYTLSAEKVFTQFATEMLRSDWPFDILSHCMLPTTSSQLALPSWIPDWTTHGWVEPFRSRSLKAHAAGDTTPKFNIDIETQTLSIWGTVISTVEDVEATKVITTDYDAPESLGAPLHKIKKLKLGDTDGIPINSMDPRQRSIERFHHLRDEARNTLFDIHRVASPSGKPTQEIRDRMARTFAFNRSRDGSAMNYEYHLGFNVHTMLTCTDETVEGVYRYMIEEATGCDEQSREGRAYRKRMTKAYEALVGSYFRWSYNRRFVRTADGSFGWAVNGVKAGDKIVAFFGCEYPFVVRAQENDQYIIVGDCYLDQFMDGEAISDDMKTECFNIV